MTEHHNPPLLSGRRMRAHWPQVLLIAIFAVGLAIAAFFFFVVALTTGAILAAVIGVRVWWLTRKLRAHARNTAALPGEYTVIQRDRTVERLDR